MVKEIQYLINDAPDYGVPLKLSERIYLLRLPLPYALDHVNVWLLESEHDWTVIDCGLGSKDCWQIWQGLLDGFLAAKPIKQIVLTHYHPDHVGLSGDLAQVTGAAVYMSRTEWLQANMLYHDRAGTLGEGMLAAFIRHGLPDDFAETMQALKTSYRDRCSKLPNAYRRIKQDDELLLGGLNWRCIEGRGHSPEHISLFCEDEKILIAGDQLLPKITPNIALPLQEISANPLAEFLRSLDNFAGIDDEVWVLPSHRLPYQGCSTRIQQLRQHHVERLEVLYEALSEPASAFDVLPVLFNRTLGHNEMMFAMLEALSHLVYLEQQELICRSERQSKIIWQQLNKLELN